MSSSQNLTFAQVLKHRAATKISSHDKHTHSSEYFAYGFGGFGQLNQATCLDMSRAQPMLDIQDPVTHQSHQVSQIACALWHTLFVTKDGELFASGRNRYGACGTDAIDRQFSTSAKRSLVLNNNAYATKHVKAQWEEDALRQQQTILEDRDNWDSEMFKLNEEEDAELSERQVHATTPNATKRVTKAAAGKYHSAILTQDNCIMICGLGCCPGNNSALLAEWEDVTGHFPVGSAGCFRDVSCGEFHTLVLMDNGIFAWGRESRLVSPVDVPYHVKSRGLKCAAGKHHGVILTQDGEIWMYGSNEFGALSGAVGKKSFVSQYSPVQLPVPPVDKPKSDAGTDETAKVEQNDDSESTDKTTTITTTQPQDDAPYWKDVACGENHIIALDSLNRIFFFGSWYSSEHQRRISYDNPLMPFPSELPYNIEIKQLVSTQSTFGFLAGGRLILAGNGAYGALGDAKKDRFTFEFVDDLNGLQVDEVHAGGHSIFLRLSSSALLDIDKMRTRHIEESHDLLLVSGSEEYKAHKSIVAARSPLLRERLLKMVAQEESTNGNMGQVLRLDVSDCIPNTILKSFMAFMYRNHARTLNREEFMMTIKALQMDEKAVMASSVASGGADTFREDIDRLRVNAKEMLHDVVFVLDDENAPEDCERNEDGDPVIYAHRVILAARCLYFYNLFYGSMMESKRKVIPLIESRYEGFAMLMRMFYTNDFSEITPDTAVEMLDYGNRFDWRDLQNEATRIIVQNITVENCFQILQIGELFESDTLQRRAIILIALHPELDSTEEYQQMSDVNKENVQDIRNHHTKVKGHGWHHNGEDATEIIQELSEFVETDREYLVRVEQSDEGTVGRILQRRSSSQVSHEDKPIDKCVIQ